jgi:hypothetical protein
VAKPIRIGLVGAGRILPAHLRGRPVRFDEVLDGRVSAYQADIDRHYGLV